MAIGTLKPYNIKTPTPTSFTIRVYGLLTENGQVLLSRENIQGDIYTKFPGGGLEFGEGVIDCLKREFMEEVAINLSHTALFYINEEFLASAFHPSKQVLSIYYKVKSTETRSIFTSDPNKNKALLPIDGDQVLYWHPIDQLDPDLFQLPIDKIVVEKLMQA